MLDVVCRAEANVTPHAPRDIPHNAKQIIQYFRQASLRELHIMQPMHLIHWSHLWLRVCMLTTRMAPQSARKQPHASQATDRGVVVCSNPVTVKPASSQCKHRQS
jgi:hypothetical protein